MSDSPISSIECAKCGAGLGERENVPVENRTKCPHCGDTARVFKVMLTSTVKITSSLRGKARDAAGGKPFPEFKSEDSFSRKLGIWAKRYMRIDRRNNRYFEEVINPESGDIIHFCDEPLSDHQGRGSAKKKDN